MRTAGAAALLAVVLAASPAAHADPPRSRIAGVVGGRLNLGDLGERYLYGYTIGGEGGYHWGWLGFTWTLLGHVFDSTDPSNATPQLTLVELGAGPRLRSELTATTRFAVYAIAEGGGTFVRSSVPLEPTNTRENFAPWAGAALDFAIGDYLITFGTRYTGMPEQPSGVTVFLALGLGTP